MKYVDEYRSPAVARSLSEQIAGLVDPGRQYKLMEVCGGHTHTI
ncbi:MAG: hydrogenase formation protein HypD, partial [Actinobacteria bacterium]|nr:hydrogenase formation protein HypD [Actinomycetota bacterium]